MTERDSAKEGGGDLREPELSSGRAEPIQLSPLFLAGEKIPSGSPNSDTLHRSAIRHLI